MDVVVITGPPASGKLTTARALAQMTGFRILDNQLIVNLASSLFEFGTDAYCEFAQTLRLTLLTVINRSAAKGVIITFCYGGPQSDYFIKGLVNLGDNDGVTVSFAHLSCLPSVLEARVASPERATAGKVTSVEVLHRILSDWAVSAPVPGIRSCLLQSDQLSPTELAVRIAAWVAQPTLSIEAPRNA